MSLSYIALALASAALVGTYLTLGRGVPYSRRALYGLLRAAALGLLALVLLRPERMTESEVPRRRTLAVMLDGSRSMSLPVARGSAYSRGAKLADILESNSVEFDALRSRYDLAGYEFDREARRLSRADEDAAAVRPPEGTGEATALGTSLVQVLDELRGGRLAGVLVLSDGASNLGVTCEGAARAFAAARTPVHAIAIGERRELVDLSVESIDVPPRARIGVPLRTTTRLRASGIRNYRAEVTIRAAHRGLDLEEVARREVSFTGEGSLVEVDATFTPRSAGTLAVEVEVAASPGEAVRTNNRRMTFVEVDDSSVRVLYVEGVLRLDFRALRRALAAAGEFEVDLLRGFLRREDGGEPAGFGGGDLGGIRPVEYDVFVVGEIGPGVLPEEFVAKIERLVRRDGRGLVVFSGPAVLARSGKSGGPFAGILPVRITDPGPSSPLRVRPTAAGGSHPALVAVSRGVSRGASRGIDERGGRTGTVWSRLGPLGDLPAAARVRKTGQALLVAEGGVPVLVAGHVGAGRVAAILSGKTHTWKDDPRAPRGAYERLARSLVAWAAGRESSNALLSVSLTRHALYVGDEVTLTARVNGDRAREAGLSQEEIDGLDLAARIVGPGGDASAETVKLQRREDGWTTTVRARAGGVFRISVGPANKDARVAPAETAFVVETDRREFRKLAAEPGTLRALAEATGGLFARADEADVVLGSLVRAPAETVTLVRRRRSVWDRAWVMFAFLGTLFLEWWMRRR